MGDEEQENYDLGEFDSKASLTKSKLKRKIRAWCKLCYQFFENSPNTKNCKEHFLRGNCNLVECKKNTVNCVRRFPNTNSENRHTYCLTKDEVENWDDSLNIQNYYSKDYNSFTSNVTNGNNTSIKGDKCIKKEETPYNEDDLSSKLTDLNKLTYPNKSENKEISMKSMTPQKFLYDFEDYSSRSVVNETEYKKEEQSLIDDFNKKLFSDLSPDKGVGYDYDHYQDKVLEQIFPNKLSKFSQGDSQGSEEFKHLYSNKSNQISSSENTSSLNKVYKLKDEVTIEELFDMVYNETHISRNILNKLKNAYKKRGFINVKILRLGKIKFKSWDFLSEDFKDVCSQVPGVSLILENLLEQLQ